MTLWTCSKCGAEFLWWPDNHLISQHVIAHQEKEEIMEDQMEQVWRSKDGKVTGSREEVEAYLKTLNPLSKMHFPYYAFKNYQKDVRIAPVAKQVCSNDLQEHAALVAFANLAPLIQDAMAKWTLAYPEWRGQDPKFWSVHHLGMVDLFTAYEEALKQVPQ